MENYGEWRVTVYDVIFRELGFLILTLLSELRVVREVRVKH